MGRRKMRLHVDRSDPWIDIHRSRPTQGGPEGDWIAGVVVVIVFVILVVWLLS